jgi:RNA polymerase sigma-70 factor (ECF subfamily)
LNGEEILIDKIKKGDVESFNILVEKYQKQVFNIAYRFVGNYEDANDIAQETFLKVYRSIKSFRKEASFKTWLYHITTNVCKDELRKKKKTKLVSLDAPVSGNDGQEFERQFESSVLSPEEKYAIKEEQKFVQKIINSLPEDYRIVLVFRELQELSYQEISDILNCSIGTVKSRLNRGRKQLKEKMISHLEQKNKNQRQIK